MQLVQEIKTLLVHMQCDKCGNGTMEPHGAAILTAPPQYPHKCTNCGHIENYNRVYPYHKHIPIELPRKPTGSEKGIGGD